ncbi:MAG: ATP-dependent zinc protease [Luteolibacter sp.]
MIGKWIIASLLALVGLTGVLQKTHSGKSEPIQRIGQTARIELPDAGIDMLARVDTGAATTSVHAEEVEIDGDRVNFSLLGRDGRKISLSRPIAKISTVRQAAGSEKRVFVELTLKHLDHARPVLVNLNDRSHLHYPMLLGRNWLENGYLVDVATPAGFPEPPLNAADPVEPSLVDS